MKNVRFCCALSTGSFFFLQWKKKSTSEPHFLIAQIAESACLHHRQKKDNLLLYEHQKKSYLAAVISRRSSHLSITYQDRRIYNIPACISLKLNFLSVKRARDEQFHSTATFLPWQQQKKHPNSTYAYVNVKM